MTRGKAKLPEKTVKAATKAETKKEKESKKKGKQFIFWLQTLISIFGDARGVPNIFVSNILNRFDPQERFKEIKEGGRKSFARKRKIPQNSKGERRAESSNYGLLLLPGREKGWMQGW